MDNMQLWEFIRHKLPFAFNGNPEMEFSKKEYKQAEKLLRPYLSHLKVYDDELVFQTFAVFIRAINNERKLIDRWDKASFKKKGKDWEHYRKMIQEFNRAMQSVAYLNYKGNNLFPVTQVILKGNQKNEEIVLEGPILKILQAMFRSFNEIKDDAALQKMRDFSSDLYNAYQKFNMEWRLLNAEEGSFAKMIIKGREKSNLKTVSNRQRHHIAYGIHIFLKHNSLPANAKYPSWHCALIGQLFDMLEIEVYLGYTDNKKVQNWIERGSPEYTGMTKKSKK